MRTKRTLTALLVAAVSLPAPAQAGLPTCRGERATIVGSRHSEVLTGTSGRDVIVGRGGRDAISGGGGNDVICGNRGRDSLSGGPGRDEIVGGASTDHFSGGAGDDLLDGGRDADEDKEWNDVLTFARSARGVVVDGPAGTAVGEGSDRLVGYFEIIVGSDLPDRIEGSVAAIELRGLAGNDHLTTQAVHGILEGGPGDDLLESSAFTGTYGSATAVYASAPAAVQVDLVAGTATGDGDDTLIGIDHVVASTHDDEVQGDDGRNIVWSNAGDDTIDGGGGDDTLFGERHNDTLRGGEGNDSLSGGGGDDDLDGGEGTDRAHGDGGSDRCAESERTESCER